MSTATEILAQMIEAKLAIEAMPPITTERRMHPDDINAMCRQFGVVKATSPFISFTGIKIIPDESAERLPRRWA